MSTFSRRRFLQWSAAGAGACALGLLGGPARAALSGRKVLEIFMRGGADPWRSFYQSYDNNSTEPDWNAFAPTSAVTTVTGLNNNKLGRAAHPLFGTTLATRIRVMCVKHDIFPHEVAVPHAMTGARLGQRIYTGFGTAVNATAADPYASVVLDTGDNVALGAATAIGAFASTFRPVALKMGDATFFSTLQRTTVSRTNELKRVLNTAYSNKLIPPGASARIRSAGFDAYDSALEKLRNSNDVLAVYGGIDLSTPATPSFTDNATRRAIRAALSLLGGSRVKYACVIDKGVYSDYDTHNGDSENGYDSPTLQAGNMWSVCDELARQAAALDAAGVMVALNTEFGRIDNDGDGTGSEHWPNGYVSVFIGDSIPTTATRGAINVTTNDEATTDTPVGFAPTKPYSPVDVRAVIAGRMNVIPSSIVDLTQLADPTLTDATIPNTLNRRILR